jgi:hypothetical protein
VPRRRIDDQTLSAVKVTSPFRAKTGYSPSLNSKNGTWGANLTSAMPMNYDIPVLSPGPISLPVPGQQARERRPNSTGRATHPIHALTRAHLEAARTEKRENLVWLALAVGGLGVLVVSFWI